MKSFLAIILWMTISCSMIHAQSVLWEPGGVCVTKNSRVEWNKQALSYPDGSVVVCWQDDISGHWQIRGMRYSADGAPMWEEPAVLADDGNYFTDYEIVSNPDGGFYVGYWRLVGEDEKDIFLQRFSAAHQPLWGDGGIVVAREAEGIEVPLLVSDGQGGVYILYSIQYESFLKRYNQDGMVLPGFENLWIPISSFLEDPAPAMISDGQGGVVIAYRVQPDIKLRRIDPDGVAVWGDAGISVHDNATIGNYRLS